MRKRPPQKNIDVHNGFGEWGGYMDAKKSKLEEQFAEDALKNPYKQSNLFAGISIFVNGLTNPSAEELKRIMMTHGGIFHTYQRSKTTFIIASNLPDVKIRQITSAKIISPQWVVDCLKANRIVDYSNYLLYTNHKVSQPKIAFQPIEIESEPTERQIVSPPSEICTKSENEIVDCKAEQLVSPSVEPPKENIKLNLDILNVAIRRDEDEPKQQNVAGIPTESETTIKASTVIEQAPKIDVKKGVARTATDPNFLAEFYNNSRLHHIATLGASFKHYISRLREAHNGQFPMLNQLKVEMQQKNLSRETVHDSIDGKLIMHIDMDCFFVSVGLRTRPKLKGLPIGVTHSKGRNANNLQNVDGVDRKKEMELYVKRHEEKYQVDRGVDDDEEREVKPRRVIDNTISLSEIASCSYEARKMGIKNGMFVGQALKLCPQLQTIPYDFDAYKEVAHILYDTICQYTMDIEAVSCDEMYVNLTNIIRTIDCSVEDFVSHIRTEIIEKTQCSCSAGIGANKLQARMATKQAKPNGQFHLRVENVENHFSSIPISDLPGVGYSTTQKCSNLGLKVCADLQRVSLVKLQQEFGKKMGETLHQNCRGIDNKPLTYDQVRKSVSAEVNYGIRFKDDQEFDSFLHQLCTEVHSRLTEISAKGKTITLKYMVRAPEAPVETAKFMGHGFCDNVTKSTTLASYTSDLSAITDTVFNIKSILNVPVHELRGIGIQISKLNTTSISDANKKNAIKNMFENMEKSKVSETTADDAGPSGKPASRFRKVKSFNGIASPNVGEKSNLSHKKLDKLFENLDLSVLAQLPHDIQDEVLREQDRMLNNEIKNPNDLNINPLKKLARKLENDFQSVDLIPSPRVSSKLVSVLQLILQRGQNNHLILSPSGIQFVCDENILKSSEWRLILDNWVDDIAGPAESDVQAISNYFKEFARAQRLTELVVILKYLHRKTITKDCQWHRIYKDIYGMVQDEVKLAFGPSIKFYAHETFDCKACIENK